MAQGGAAAVGSDEPRGRQLGGSPARGADTRAGAPSRPQDAGASKEVLAKAQAKKPSLQRVLPLKDASR
jgi:hypothetical protein